MIGKVRVVKNNTVYTRYYSAKPGETVVSTYKDGEKIKRKLQAYEPKPKEFGFPKLRS